MDSAFLAKITKVEAKTPSVAPLFNVEWQGGSDQLQNASSGPVNAALKSWADSQNIQYATFNVISGDKNTVLKIEAS